MTANDDFSTFLDGVAEKYRRSGYKVTVRPHDRQLPKLLKGTTPDIVAVGDRKSVAVGIKRLGSAQGDSRLLKIAQLVEGHPDWQFDVVLYERVSQRPDRLPTKARIQQSLQTAEKLFQQGDEAAAFLLGWSAFEAAARRAIRRASGEDIGRRPSLDLLKALLSYGLLDEEEHRRLLGVARRRNEIVHGELELSVVPLFVPLKHAARRLLDNRVVETA